MQPEGYHKKFNMHGHGQAYIAQHQALAAHPQRPVHVGVPAMPSPGQVPVAPFGQAQLIGLPPPGNQPFLFPTPMHSQFVQAGQLPQVPGNVLLTEQPVLFCIPMIFNTREMTWSCQSGFYVHPNTSTFVAGYHIMHHGMQLPNGFGGPNPNIAHSQPQTGSPSGSNYTDSSSSGSRDNLVAHEPHARSPGSHGAVPPVSGAMVNGGIMYGYPQHHMGHIGVQQQNVSGAGFQSGLPTSYAQGGRNIQGVQGGQSDNANNASRMQADGQVLVGSAEGDERKPAEQGNRDIQDGSSTVQSRSSSLGSAFESEQPHEGDGDAADGGHKMDGHEGGDYSRSSSSDDAELPVGGDDHTVEELEAISRGQSGMKSAVSEQAEPKSVASQVYQRSGQNSPAVEVMGRSGSAVEGALLHDADKDLSRTSSMSSQTKTFTAEGNGGDAARGSDSPFVDQARLSSHTPDRATGKESDQNISPSAIQQDGVPAAVADAPQSSTPKSWADLAARNVSKPAAAAGNKASARPTITPRSESASERKLLDKTVVVKQPEKVMPVMIQAPSRPGMTYGGSQYRPTNSGGGYMNNGASRSFYQQRQPGTPRDYEFPRLAREDAEKFPKISRSTCKTYLVRCPLQ
ncbi:uncharacterized protein LOC129591535 [Paramacrobiotus metropolitanus]|uniref:uncharacterized protein LOC129591535 n=1 Tax=Paramacrobiotus metropolitanus TaxID=2943436 RepID=UPI0024463907|nr:uncharacterized protein LOC129591535 [Paramacrobiotus metropolitanus]